MNARIGPCACEVDVSELLLLSGSWHRGVGCAAKWAELICLLCRQAWCMTT